MANQFHRTAARRPENDLHHDRITCHATYLLRTEEAIDDKVNTAQETYPLDKESA